VGAGIRDVASDADQIECDIHMLERGLIGTLGKGCGKCRSNRSRGVGLRGFIDSAARSTIAVNTSNLWFQGDRVSAQPSFPRSRSQDSEWIEAAEKREALLA
jgi:hypothetical protein